MNRYRHLKASRMAMILYLQCWSKETQLWIKNFWCPHWRRGLNFEYSIPSSKIFFSEWGSSQKFMDQSCVSFDQHCTWKEDGKIYPWSRPHIPEYLQQQNATYLSTNDKLYSTAIPSIHEITLSLAFLSKKHTISLAFFCQNHTLDVGTSAVLHI